MKLLIVLISFLVSTASAQAGGEIGSGVRGGGSAVWMNGHWELRDVFILNLPGEPLYLSEGLKSVVREQVRPLVELYAGKSANDYWNAIVDDAADFRLVDELPCESNGETLGANEENYGCTKDGTTYLVRRIFETFDNRAKILALMHQRAHAVDPANEHAHDWIEPFVAATDLLLKLDHEQSKGIWRKIRGAELGLLDRLADGRITQRIGASGSHGIVASQGAGLIRTEDFLSGGRNDVKIDETSFLGVGSILSVRRSECDYSGDFATFVDRYVRSQTWAKNGTRVVNSFVGCTTLDGAEIENSTLQRDLILNIDQTALGNRIVGSKVVDTQLKFTGRLVIGSTLIDRSKLVFLGGGNIDLADSRLVNVDFQPPNFLQQDLEHRVPSRRLRYASYRLLNRAHVYQRRTGLEAQLYLYYSN